MDADPTVGLILYYATVDLLGDYNFLAGEKMTQPGILATWPVTGTYSTNGTSLEPCAKPGCIDTRPGLKIQVNCHVLESWFISELRSLNENYIVNEESP